METTQPNYRAVVEMSLANGEKLERQMVLANLNALMDLNFVNPVMATMLDNEVDNF